MTPNKLKVFVVCYTGNSGLTDYAISLAKALGELVNVRLITGYKFNDSYGCSNFEVEKIFRKSRNYFTDIIKFVMYCIKNKPNWLILQGPIRFPFFDIIILSFIRLVGIKICIVVHDLYPHYPNIISKQNFINLYRLSDKLVVSSLAVKAELELRGMKNNILICPHPIHNMFKSDTYNKTSAKNSIPGLSSNDFVILFFGHLESRKGMFELISAAHLMDGEVNYKFIFAGVFDPNTFTDSELILIDKVIKQKNVIFNNYYVEHDDVEKYFMASNLVMIPYREGTTSGVLKLAICFGVPVVASIIGDIRDEMPPNSGILLEPEKINGNSLMSAIYELKRNEFLYKENMAKLNNQISWEQAALNILSHINH